MGASHVQRIGVPALQYGKVTVHPEANEAPPRLFSPASNGMGGGESSPLHDDDAERDPASHDGEKDSAEGWPQFSTCERQQKTPAGPSLPLQYCAPCAPGLAQT